MTTSGIFGLLGLADMAPPNFFASRDQIRDRFKASTTAHHLLKAWDLLALTGIYCVENRPTVFFCRPAHADEAFLKQVHRTFWNLGQAPLLVVEAPDRVVVLSSAVFPAGPGEAFSATHRIVRLLDLAADGLAFVQAVNTGTLFTSHPHCFSQEACVDRYLVQNLSDLGEQMRLALGLADLGLVHRFLCALVFLLYLQDRGMIGPSWFEAVGGRSCRGVRDLLRSEDVAAARALTTLFRRLRDTFNGSLFDDPDLRFSDILQPKIMPWLRAFLEGDHLASGQMSLGFWAYDFSAIPIEMISTVYESFLGAEETRASGTYYTPLPLAEMTVDLALDGCAAEPERVMDPACGSGIFLVVLFGRMANAWEYDNPNPGLRQKYEALCGMLQNRLAGVDINETACRITCLSLYLALLDRLEPRDIDRLKEQGKVLPSLLAFRDDDPSKTAGIHCGDFFSMMSPLSAFDLVIGNPPWVSRQEVPGALGWMKNTVQPDRYGVAARERDGVFLPQKELSCGFAWKAAVHLRAGGTACLLLPARVLFNAYHAFTRAFFAAFPVDRVLLLADWRRLLFQGAIAPAAAVRWHLRPTQAKDMISYLVPKVMPLDPRRGMVPVYACDWKRIPRTDVVAAAGAKASAALWKKHFWGTYRDVALIEELAQMPALAELAGRDGEGKRWVRGQGFKPSYRQEPLMAWWSEGHAYVNAKSTFSYLLSAEQCVPVDPAMRRLRRSPTRRLFQAPMVLISQGATKSAFCDFPVLFQDSLQSIAGPEEDREMLRFLAVVLRSRLAAYFLFHTSGSQGIERDKVHFASLLHVPFFLPEDAPDPKQARARVAEASEILDRLQERRRVCGDATLAPAEMVARLDALVYAYYGLSDADVVLVEDFHEVVKKSLQPAHFFAPVPTVRPPTREQRRAYVVLLVETLSGWARRGGMVINGMVYHGFGVSLVRLQKAHQAAPFEEIDQEEVLEAALEKVFDLAGVTHAGWVQQRDVRVFDGDCFFMVKPMHYRFWTRTQALNDADEVALSILQAMRSRA